MRKLIILAALFVLVPSAFAHPHFQAAATLAASTGVDVTVTLPAHQAGDIFLEMCLVRDVDDTAAITGWTAVAGTPFDRGSTARYWAFWKRAASAAETNPLFDKSGTTGDTYCNVITFRGAKASGNPWEVEGATSTSTADPEPLTSITTAITGDLIVGAFGAEDNNNATVTVTGTSPSTFTNNFQVSGTGADGGIGFAYNTQNNVGTPGATGTVNVDWVTANPVGSGGLLLALKPPTTLLSMKQQTNSVSGLTGYFYSRTVPSVLAVTTGVTNSILGTTTGVQMTKTAAGTVMQWISPPVTTGFTLAGIVTGNAWALESNALCNCGLQFKVILFTGGAESTVILNTEYGTELPTSNTNVTWTATPSSTAVAAGDRLVFEWYINDAGGTMASGQTVTMNYGGLNLNLTGDVDIGLDEAVVFDSEGEYVQGGAANPGAGSSVACALPGISAAGNLIVNHITWGGAVTANTPTDDKSDTYASIVTKTDYDTGLHSQNWYAKNIVGGSATTITTGMSGSISTQFTGDCVEFAGLDTSSPLDVTVSATGVTPATPDSGSVSTNYSNEILVGLAAGDGSNGGFNSGSVGANYIYATGAGTVDSMIEHRSVTATGSYKSLSVEDANAWAMFMGAFKWGTQPAPPPTGCLTRITLLHAGQC